MFQAIQNFLQKWPEAKKSYVGVHIQNLKTITIYENEVFQPQCYFTK